MSMGLSVRGVVGRSVSPLGVQGKDRGHWPLRKTIRGGAPTQALEFEHVQA